MRHFTDGDIDRVLAGADIEGALRTAPAVRGALEIVELGEVLAGPGSRP